MTNEAFIPLMSRRASAACAISTETLRLGSDIYEIAILYGSLSALVMISAFFWKISMSVWKNCLTAEGSAPCLLSHDAASNVRTPVLTEKFFVSRTIPASITSASKSLMPFFSVVVYCSISVTSSHADDA